MNPARALLATPSNYGLAAFVPALLAYCYYGVGWHHPSQEVLFVSILYISVLLASSLVHFFINRRSPDIEFTTALPQQSSYGAHVLTILGVLGTSIYLVDMASVMGGLDAVLMSLMIDPLAVRGSIPEAISVGIYISYFGWAAAVLYAMDIGKGHPNWKRRVVLILLIVLSNLVFIDRTRPIWIGFTAIVSMLICRPGLNMRNGFLHIGVWVVGGWIFFMAFAMFTGKYPESPVSAFESALDSFFFYLTAGLAYLSRLLAESGSPDYLPMSMLSPAFQITHVFGLSDAPPNRVLEPFYVPFPTNVGTSLEPFFSDGGYVYLVPGMLICGFGLNFLGTFFLRYGGALGVVAWSHACFAAFIGFFVPKLHSPTFWLMVFLGLAGMMHRMLATRST